MAESSVEAKVRAALPLTRLMNGYMPLSLIRWILKKTVARVQLPAAISRQPVTADGVPCEWLIPQNSPPDHVLLYLHGGGFVIGSSHLHYQMVASLTEKMGIRALMVDYRIAPEHPFPAALDDCVTAYRWLLKQGFSPKNIVIAGDSAGGNLTITSMMKLRDSGDPSPAAGACLSPVADLSQNSDMTKGAYDPLLHPRAVRLYLTSYVAGNDPRNPLMSPVFGDWRGLPPLLIHAGEDEALRSDAVQCDQLAKAAGVDVRLEVYPRMWHVWQIQLELPQTQQSLDDIAQFFKAHLPVFN